MIIGDFTKDGELAGKLKELKKRLPNLHIYVTPDNYDICNNNVMN